MEQLEFTWDNKRFKAIKDASGRYTIFLFDGSIYASSVHYSLLSHWIAEEVGKKLTNTTVQEFERSVNDSLGRGGNIAQYPNQKTGI